MDALRCSDALFSILPDLSSIDICGATADFNWSADNTMVCTHVIWASTHCKSAAINLMCSDILSAADIFSILPDLSSIDTCGATADFIWSADNTMVAPDSLS